MLVLLGNLIFSSMVIW